MVLLQEGFAAFRTDVRSQRATPIRMALVVQHQAVLRHKALPAELAEVRFRLLLRRRRDLHDRRLLHLLVLLLLRDLHGLLLHHLLLDLRIRRLLRLLRLMDLNLLVLLR